MYAYVIKSRCDAKIVQINLDGLEQDCSISSANALEILQSCTKLSVWSQNNHQKYILIIDGQNIDFNYQSIPQFICMILWRHDRKTHSTVLALCEGNPQVTAWLPSNVGLWCFLCYQSEQHVEHSRVAVICNAMTLMYQNWDDFIKRHKKYN